MKNCHWLSLPFRKFAAFTIAVALFVSSEMKAQFVPDSEILSPGLLDGMDNYSTAEAINNLGQVVGVADSYQGRPHAFSWTEEDGGTELLYDYSHAYDINNLGQAVGVFERGYSIAYGFGVGGYLGTLGGSQSRALGVNDAGQIVGESEVNGSSEIHAFYWDNESGMIDLGALRGEGYSSAQAINNLGQVVGLFPGGASMWTVEDGFTSIGVAGQDINDIGQVLGGNSIWTEEEGTTPLAFNPYAINNLGWVVGANAESHAVAYADGSTVDLNDLFASNMSDGSEPGFTVLTVARDINDLGQIVGEGIYIDESGEEYIRAFMVKVTAASGDTRYIFLNVNNTNFGQVSGPTTGSVNTAITIEALPKAGYMFDHWEGDFEGVENPASLTVSKEMVITAHFTKDQGDDDNDGLSNYEEAIVYGTTINDPDSDSDSLRDGDEIILGFDPLTDDSDLISKIVELRTAFGLHSEAEMTEARAAERASILEDPSSVGLFATQTVNYFRFGETSVERSGELWEIKWSLLQSDDLSEWTEAGGLETSIEMLDGHEFFRIMLK